MATNREIFFNAVFVEPPKICGKKLKPYSLAHDYFLRYLKNPLVVGGETSDEDLLNAIFVCSLSYRQLKRFLNYPKRFMAMLWFLRWRIKDLEIARKSFRLYIGEYFEIPDHFTPYAPVSPDAALFATEAKEKGKPYAAPWQYHLVHTLCFCYGCSLDEAWNTPVTTARCYHDVWSESTGLDNSLVSEFQEASARGEI